MKGTDFGDQWPNGFYFFPGVAAWFRRSDQ